MVSGQDESALLTGWHTAYHGTRRANAGKIFFDGQLRKPGHGAKVAHGQAGSLTGTTIYVSPAKELSAFPVYSEIFQLHPHRKPSTPQRQGDLVTNKFAQVLFEVKVKHGSYRIKPSTLRQNGHWPRSLRIDTRFATHDDLEWLLESSGDIVLSAILVRQFGEGSEAFGHLNARVSGDYKSADSVSHGADYHWTTLRQEDGRTACSRR